MSEAEHSIILGMTGAGKTTLNEGLVRPCRRIITVTTKPKAKAYSRGWLEATTSKEVIGHVRRNWNSRKGFRIVWRCLPTNKKLDPVKLLDWLCESLFQWQDGYSNGKDNRQVVLNIDEAQDFFPHNTPDSHWFAKVMAQGRDWGINAVIGTQGPQNMHPKVRRGITNIYSLKVAGDRELAMVLSLVGKAERERIVAVPQFEYAYYRHNQFVSQNSTRKPVIQRPLP